MIQQDKAALCGFARIYVEVRMLLAV